MSVELLSKAQKRLRGVAVDHKGFEPLSPWPGEIAWRIEQHRKFGDMEHAGSVSYRFPLGVLPFDKISDEDLALCELVTLANHANDFLDSCRVVGDARAEHTAFLFLTLLDSFADFTRL